MPSTPGIDIHADEMAYEEYVLGRFFGDNPQTLVAYTPHCVELGVVAVHAAPGTATLKIPYRADLVGDPARGVVFGGVITTLLDQAGGVAVMCSLEQVRSVATIDLRIDYMRPATPGRDLIGRARCYRSTCRAPRESPRLVQGAAARLRSCRARVSDTITRGRSRQPAVRRE